MKILKRLFAVVIIVIALSALTVTVLAATSEKPKTPAEIVATLTGLTTEEVVTEARTYGKTFGEIANEAGKLDEFHDEMLELRKARLDLQVERGRLTKQQAAEALEAFAEAQLLCDGTGNCVIGGGCSLNGTGLGNGGCGNGGGYGGGGCGRNGGGRMNYGGARYTA